MKKELRDRWCAALRSGEFRQGIDVLRSDDEIPTYCCLGVLAAIAEPELWDGNVHDGEVAELNSRHLHEYGLTEGDQGRLISWNDRDQLNFNQIADKIERHIHIEEPAS